MGVLPVAILLAAYAPRAISFAAGQAGFTVVLFILFNIIQPVGWSVGAGSGRGRRHRLRDQPRRRSPVLAARRRCAPARRPRRPRMQRGVGLRRRHRPRADRRRLRRTRLGLRAPRTPLLHRLDDAFRQYLAERSASGSTLRTSQRFVGGASRVRRAGPVARRARTHGRSRPRLERCGANLDRELHALQAWYVALGYALDQRSPGAAAAHPRRRGPQPLLACVRDGARGRRQGDGRRRAGAALGEPASRQPLAPRGAPGRTRKRRTSGFGPVGQSFCSMRRRPRWTRAQPMSTATMTGSTA